MSGDVRRAPGPEGDDRDWSVVEDPQKEPYHFVLPVNWMEYEKTFPVRYIEDGEFDERVGELLDEQMGLDVGVAGDFRTQVLDIGGGINGTQALTDPLPGNGAPEIYLLDPNVDEAPEWMKGKLRWDEAVLHEFGLIVARGSINYLSPEEIENIPSMLAPDGVFLFNSFMRRATASRAGERPYVTRDGRKGIERWTYDEDRKVILHELEPEREGERVLIRHSFFYYSIEDFISMLRPKRLDGLSFFLHGTSSIIGELRR